MTTSPKPVHAYLVDGVTEHHDQVTRAKARAREGQATHLHLHDFGRRCTELCEVYEPPFRPSYVYVASSWRNPMQPEVCQILKAAGIDHYDFRNPPGGTGFSWREVKTDVPSVAPLPCRHSTVVDGLAITCRECRPDGPKPKGADWENVDEYLRMLEHPRAVEGFTADFNAMQKADTFVMVLPCGKSAHLELGWATGAGKRTAILLEDPVEPELMYLCADYLAPSVHDLLGWLGVDEHPGDLR